jgi:anti-sigma B factor antagonist
MDLITEEAIGDVSVIELQAGTLDANNANDFKSAISPILKEKTKVVLDLNKVDFLDSSGCGSILSCLRQLNSAGGDLKICETRKPVLTLFELIRLHRIIEIFNTREEAVKSF